MRRFLPILIAVCAGCGGEPSEAAPVDELTKKLVAQHDEIWALMGLSPSATEELNGIVRAVSRCLSRNRTEHPERFQKPPKREEKPKSREEYLAAHRSRFDKLKISAATQRELMQAAEVVYRDLHDPSVPAEERQRAEKIQGMMKSLGGPPPCCDDGIFEKAARN